METMKLTLTLATVELSSLRKTHHRYRYAAYHWKRIWHHVCLYLVSLSSCITFSHQLTNSSPPEDAPRFIRGHAVTLSMVGFGTCVYAFMWFWYQRANKRRDAGEVEAEHRGLSDDELKELGDESPHYRYTI
jgi:hypothetical protein